MSKWSSVLTGGALSLTLFLAVGALGQEFGKEVAVAKHLADGEEYAASIQTLNAHGQLLFQANWTDQEGGGRPLTKGNGNPVKDGADPLVFPRNFNRVSAPDANSCFGCHGVPRSGGGGDIVANVFVLGQRFDFADFNHDDVTPTKGAVDEKGDFATLNDIANSRLTLGMFGSGYIEALARQMTIDLRNIRSTLQPGQSAALVSKGVSFGTLRRNPDGTWDTTGVEGMPDTSLTSTGASSPPSLILRPFHQAGAVVSVREFTNNAFNHHHGIQATERFGVGTDADGDGFTNEMTRADVTAASLYQIILPVPGRVIPRDAAVEAVVLRGEQKFAQVGCTSCHIPELPLSDWGWLHTEPNRFNPAGNLRPGDAPDLVVNLNRRDLPLPRLRSNAAGVTMVPAYTDLKLHDITSGADDPNREALNMLKPAGSSGFFAGNSRFLTRKLWGIANEPPFFHHGKMTTMRAAILAHAGEAQATTDAFNALSESDKDAIIEFLKTLQVLPEGTPSTIVDEHFQPREWPPAGG